MEQLEPAQVLQDQQTGIMRELFNPALGPEQRLMWLRRLDENQQGWATLRSSTIQMQQVRAADLVAMGDEIQALQTQLRSVRLLLAQSLGDKQRLLFGNQALKAREGVLVTLLQKAGIPDKQVNSELNYATTNHAP